jgi:uncharacterized membrane protein
MESCATFFVMSWLCEIGWALMAKANRSGFALPAVLGILALTSLACATVWRMQWVNQQLLNVQSHLVIHQQIAEGILPLVVQDIIGASAAVAQTHNPMRFSPATPKSATNCNCD